MGLGQNAERLEAANEPGSEGRQGRRRLRRGKTGRRSGRRRVFGVFRVCRVLTVVLARPVTSGHQPLPVLPGHGNQGSEPWRLSVTLEGLGVTLDESPNHLQGSAGGERRLHVSSAGGVEAVPSHVERRTSRVTGSQAQAPGPSQTPRPALRLQGRFLDQVVMWGTQPCSSRVTRETWAPTHGLGRVLQETLVCAPRVHEYDQTFPLTSQADLRSLRKHP